MNQQILNIRQRVKVLQMIFSLPFWCPHPHLSICFGKICLKLHHHQAFHLSPEIEKKTNDE